MLLGVGFESKKPSSLTSSLFCHYLLVVGDVSSLTSLFQLPCLSLTAPPCHNRPLFLGSVSQNKLLQSCLGHSAL